jgi:hypothetical protein
MTYRHFSTHVTVCLFTRLQGLSANRAASLTWLVKLQAGPLYYVKKSARYKNMKTFSACVFSASVTDHLKPSGYYMYHQV